MTPEDIFYTALVLAGFVFTYQAGRCNFFNVMVEMFAAKLEELASAAEDKGGEDDA